MTHRFIDEHKDQWPVRLLCETLEVSPAGYYAWRQCPRSAGQQRRDALLVEVRAIHAEVRANYLASPPLVVAYALAGRMDIDLYNEPLGIGSDGKPVFLRGIWPTQKEIRDAVEHGVQSTMFQKVYSEVFTQYAMLRPAGITAPDAPTVRIKVAKTPEGATLPGYAFTQEGSF